MQQINDNTFQQKITLAEDPLITHNDEKKTKKSSEEKLKPKSGRKKTSTSSIVTQPVNSNTTSHLAIVPTRTVHSEGTTFTSWAKSKHYTR